jgi:hypothetical protein
MWARGKLGRTRALSVSVRVDANLTQIWAKDGSGRTRSSGCVASLGGRWRRTGPVGPVRTCADVMCRPAGDALRTSLEYKCFFRANHIFYYLNIKLQEAIFYLSIIILLKQLTIDG